jgi:hypothetical protein
MSHRGLNYQHIRSLVSIADVATRLEAAQREQIQSSTQLATDLFMKWDQRLGIGDDALEREEEENSSVESQSKPYRPNQSSHPVYPYGNYYWPSRANPLLGWVPVRVPREHRRQEPQPEHEEFGDDLMRAMERLAGVSNVVENGVVKGFDDLLQSVHIP